MNQNLQQRIHHYLHKKGKLRPKQEVTPSVKEEEGEVCEELSFDNEWEVFKEEHSFAILVIKSILGFILLVTLLWALAVVDIQSDCYADRECREWIERNR